MHAFQPYPMDMLDWNPFKKIGNDWCAITAEKDGKVNTMTASWGGVGVLWGKNVATIYIRDTRYTKEFVDGSDTFSLTFFPESYKSTLSFLGKVSGRDEDKISEARLHIDHYKETPYIDEGNFVIICRKMSATRITEDSFLDPEIKEKWYKDNNMHTMYIGEIIDIIAR